MEGVVVEAVEEIGEDVIEETDEDTGEKASEEQWKTISLQEYKNLKQQVRQVERLQNTIKDMAELNKSKDSQLEDLQRAYQIKTNKCIDISNLPTVSFYYKSYSVLF